jgi:hypothetical protein
MIDIGQSKSHGGFHDYVYIYQQKPTPVFKGDRTSPPSVLFDVAEETILEPIFEEVLKSLELSSGYSLPPTQAMIHRARGNRFLKERFGRPMPKVLLVEE